MTVKSIAEWQHASLRRSIDAACCHDLLDPVGHNAMGLLRRVPVGTREFINDSMSTNVPREVIKRMKRVGTLAVERCVVVDSVGVQTRTKCEDYVTTSEICS
jgi:hypothetical protein